MKLLCQVSRVSLARSSLGIRPGIRRMGPIVGGMDLGRRFKSGITTEIGAINPAASASSTAATSVDAAATSAVDAAASSDVVGAATTAATDAFAAVSAVPPTQVGYFDSIGLAQSWLWPSGFFEHIFEMTHVYSGLPWWATILAVTVGTRLVMLPLYISSSDGTAKMARIKPELQEIMERTKNATDQGEIQKCMLARKKLMKDNNVKLLDMVKPIASVPIFLGVFGALSKMASHHVAGFDTQGLFWFQNLAAPDPYLGLQVLTAVLYAVTFKVFGGETGAANLTPVMKKVFTWMPFVAIPLTMGLPAAVCFYFAINGTFSVIQSNLLKSTWVRSKLGLAPMVTKEEQREIDRRLGKKQSDSVIGAIRQKYEDAKEQAEKKVQQDMKERLKKQEQEVKRNAGYVQFRK